MIQMGCNVSKGTCGEAGDHDLPRVAWGEDLRSDGQEGLVDLRREVG
jgi:hypothetical protein